MHGLPSRIVAGMIGTILVFLLAVGVSILWLALAMDGQALRQSQAQMRMARTNLLDQVRLTTLDYAKWGTAVDAVEAADVGWLYDNIGAAATLGQVVQLVGMWGGRLGEERAWTDDDVTLARSGLVDPALLGLAETRLREVPLGTYAGTEFFAWHAGAVFAFGVSRFEVVDGSRPLPTVDADLLRLAMGRRLTGDVLVAIGDSLLLDGLQVVHAQPADRPALPLAGADGAPVAWLAWDAARPGTALLREMLPLLLLVIAVGLCAAAFGAILARRGATHLVTAERQATLASRTDAMTGLPNRVAFGEALARPARAGERAILFLDINDFKRINDSIGHEAGDRVIIEVGARLSSLAGRQVMLARIAGDEFVYVVDGAGAGPRAQRLATSVQRAFLPHFAVFGHLLRVSIAVGYAVQLDDHMPEDGLVRQADLAMYEAKRHKGGRPVAFSAVIEQSSRDAERIEKGLRAALDSPGEISLAYQPIVAADGRMVRAEALARWTSVELGPVSPDRFIRVAEQAGLMVPLGRLLFRLACDDLASHLGLRISLNISPLQLMAPDFIPMITGELAERGIDASRIEIELTEAVVVDDPRLAAERLSELHAAGFTTALDDFGTGFSSVGYLGQLGFDTLKIDRSFITRSRASAAGVEVVRGMIIMSHGLGLRVVCEGIEERSDLDLLFDLGCDLAQGFHIDRPLRICDLIERWLDAPNLRAAVA